MPLLKAEEISEEERHSIIEKAFFPDKSKFPLPCVRFFAPLVMVALRRANNPYLTGRKGFDALGIEFGEDGKQITPPAEFFMLMMIKTAELLVCFSCTVDELKAFTMSSVILESAAMDLMEEHLGDMDKMASAAEFVSEQMEILVKSQAKKSSKDDKPSAEAIEKTGKKKHGHTG